MGTAAAFAAGPDSREIFRAAVKADLAGDAARAFTLYRQSASAGLAEAEFNVAVMEDAGRGTAHDIRAAALHYAMAASGGEGRAAYNLALLYADGEGVPRNADLAAAWFAEAARLGVEAAAGRNHASKVGGSTIAATPLAAFYPPAGQSPEQIGGAVPFVWEAGQGPPDTRFYLQIVGLTGETPRPVLDRLLDLSATSVKLDKGNYAWRVFSFSDRAGAYRATDWARFTIP